jgi:predicted permease
VAVAFVLLVLAGLFSVNLRRVKDLDVGFARQQLLLAELEPTLNGYSDEKRLILYRQIDERLREASETKSSGIEDGALSNVAPMSPFTWSSLFLIAGRQQHDKDIIPRAVAVGPQYFATMKIPLRRGRVLTARDDLSAPRVAVISESLARREFPASDPIGQHFTSDLRKPAESTFEIVGIVGDTELQDPRNRGDRDCVYLPYRQWPFTPQAIVLQLRLRSPKSTTAAVATIRRIIGELDPRLALYDIRTIETALDALLIAERLAVVLSNLFAGLAALLVCIGLYGVLAREVAVRTREVGIRLALGASRAAVLWALTRGTLLFVTCGTAAGVIAAIWLRPAIRPLMLETGVVDGPVIIAALAFVIVISTGAALLPARRATRIDPATALRWE